MDRRMNVGRMIKAAGVADKKKRVRYWVGYAKRTKQRTNNDKQWTKKAGGRERS